MISMYDTSDDTIMIYILQTPGQPRAGVPPGREGSIVKTLRLYT